MSLDPEDTQVQVSYNGKVIIPVGTFSATRTYDRSADGIKRRKGWQFAMGGTILAFKGSPDSFGIFQMGPGYPDDEDPSDIGEEKLFNNLQVKIKALTGLFSVDGQELLINPIFGQALRLRPRWDKLQYQEGRWFNNLKWDITGEADYIEGYDDFEGEAPEETWSIEQTDEVGRLYKLTHTVSAQAKIRYNVDGTSTQGWEVARDLVLGTGSTGIRCSVSGTTISAVAHGLSNGQPVRVGSYVGRTTGNLDPAIIYYVVGKTDNSFQVALTVGGSPLDAGIEDSMSFGKYTLGMQDVNKYKAQTVLDLNTSSCYNYTRSQNTNEAAGSFSITEMWVVFDNTGSPTGLVGGAAVEDFNIETKTSIDTGLTTVQLQGSINGLENRDLISRTLLTGRWTNALARSTGVTDTWAAGIANLYSGITINPQPTNKTISRNTITGLYGYNFGFDTRPATSDPGNILSEIISVDFDNACPIIAQIPVPNRVAGPVLQNPNTVTQQSVTVTYDITKKVSYGVTTSVPSTNPYAVAIAAIGSTPSTIFMVNDKPRWTPNNGKYSRTTTFIYQS